MPTEQTRTDDFDGLLREACAELRRRFLTDPATRSEVILGEYPDLTQSPPRAVELIRLEWQLRRDHGEAPSHEAWFERFPQWRPLLIERLAQRDSCDDEEGLTTVVDANRNDSVEELAQDLSEHEVYEELGRGGMGVVFRAYDRVLRRMVALKVIRSGLLASPEEVRRFYREARTAAQLEHPNLIAIYGMGRYSEQHSFTMPLADGGSLAGRRDEFREPRRAAELLEILADAVAHAHGRGIVHRDLKPANVLFTRDNRPLVSDFGLARAFLGSGELTIYGQVLGTPSYMAPEQAAGQSYRVGPASDVWSLGVILYELVVGERPFVAEASDQLLACVIAAEFDPPRSRRPELDPALEQILLRCLRKGPEDRYPDAGALRDDLRRWLGGQPLGADPARPVTPRRRRWPLLAMSLAGLILVAFVALPVVLRTLTPRTDTPATGSSSEPRRPSLPLQLSRGEGKVTARPDGAIEIAAPEARAWAAVCEAPEWPAYRFRVDVENVRPTTQAVGVFWDFGSVVEESGESCWFTSWAYSAFGREVVVGNARAPSPCLSHEFRRDVFSRSGRSKPLDFVRGTTDQPFRFPDAGPLTLTVEVRPTGYRLFVGDGPSARLLLSVDSEKVHYNWDRLFKANPPIHPPRPTVGRGRMGLYCQDGAATFRNFVLEPLP